MSKFSGNNLVNTENTGHIVTAYFLTNKLKGIPKTSSMKKFNNEENLILGNKN